MKKKQILWQTVFCMFYFLENSWIHIYTSSCYRMFGSRFHHCKSFILLSPSKTCYKHTSSFKLSIFWTVIKSKLRAGVLKFSEWWMRNQNKNKYYFLFSICSLAILIHFSALSITLWERRLVHFLPATWLLWNGALWWKSTTPLLNFLSCSLW